MMEVVEETEKQLLFLLMENTLRKSVQNIRSTV